MSIVSAILLGAGESKRMGVDKLCLPWGEKTIFERTLEILLNAEVKEVIAVIKRSKRSMIHVVKNPKVKIVTNPYYQYGMSTSIQRGISAIHPETQGILIALGDQPLLKTRTINALIHVFRKNKKTIVVPIYKGKRGHPVIFHRCYINELLKLKGDEGGRSIIEKFPQEVRWVRVRSEGVTKDIDTWKDYKKIIK